MAEFRTATIDTERTGTNGSSRRGIIVLVAFCAYVVLCRSLRYVRRDRKHAQYPYKKRADFAKMTAQHAYEIQKYVTSLEFPMLSQMALQFALFKTYAIPTISSLLCATRQLSEEEHAGRRYADTSILIAEFLSWAPDSLRTNSAIARMNYIHGLYQKSGKISNDDMLYTLSLFVLELRRWIDTYEWRKLTEMEVCAIGTLWKSIGDAMNVSFEPLGHGPDSFTDGLQFVEDLQEWADAYERRVMVPNAHNHKVAEETTKLLLFDAPRFMVPAGRQAVIAMMDERLRKAMIYDPPSPLAVSVVQSLIAFRKFVIRWLLPPRPYSLRFRYFTDQPDPKTGRYHQFPWVGEPWYVKSDVSTRFSLDSCMRWMTGRPYPDGKNFQPEGYNIMEMGPLNLEKLGAKECEETKDRLMAANRGRCPFSAV